MDGYALSKIICSVFGSAPLLSPSVAVISVPFFVKISLLYAKTRLLSTILRRGAHLFYAFPRSPSAFL